MITNDISKEAFHSGSGPLRSNISTASSSFLGYLDYSINSDPKSIRDNQSPLGEVTYKLASFLPTKAKTSNKWERQRVCKHVMQGTGHAVLSCMRSRNGHADIMQDTKTGKSYYGSVIKCGSVWVCPVCSSRIAYKRREELRHALEHTNLTPVMITATLQHKASDKLDNLMDGLNDSLRKLKSGRWWESFKQRHHVKASISSLEVRVSVKAGWHPHKHILLFLDQALDKISCEVMRQEITDRYKYLLAKSGNYASKYHGIKVQIGNQYASKYISKWGLESEVTLANVKKSKGDSVHPFELMDLTDKGDKRARALWFEYVKAIKGKRQITWGRGSRQALDVGAEVSDLELANSEGEDNLGEDELVVRIPSKAWNWILEEGLAGYVLFIADNHGPEAVREYIDTIVKQVMGDEVALLLKDSVGCLEAI